MKKRDGFVSNSSSSSFVIFLKRKPKDYKETAELFFGNASPSFLNEMESIEYMEEGCKRADMAKMLHEEIIKWFEGQDEIDVPYNNFSYCFDYSSNILGTNKTLCDISKELQALRSNIDSIPWDSPERERFEKLINEETCKAFQKYIKDNKLEKFFQVIMTFSSDNENTECALKYSERWKNFKGIRTSG